MKKEKVFCGKCEYYDGFYPDDDYDVCRHPELQISKINPVRAYKEPQLCFKLNKNNSCKYFKLYEPKEPVSIFSKFIKDLKEMFPKIKKYTMKEVK